MQVLSVMHGIQQLLFHFKLLTPAPGEHGAQHIEWSEGCDRVMFKLSTAQTFSVQGVSPGQTMRPVQSRRLFAALQHHTATLCLHPSTWL
jgi:hypothetical protein